MDPVDRLVAERPGRGLMTPRYDDPAHPVNDNLFRSGGTTASYCLLTDGGRIIVNTGLGYEAPHHKRVFDALRPGPTHLIITTQGHVDHVGGVALFRDPDTVYVAQANNAACQRDDARIRAFRMRTAGIWFDMTGRDATRIATENPGVSMPQDSPVPDLTFTDRLGTTVDGTRLELVAAVGETIDSAIVWLPDHRTALISNLLGPLFPHFPNLNTLRGDRYRLVEPYLASIRTLRDLRPETLVTGRGDPVTGEALIDACLARLHDAVDWVHREVLRGMNAGTDVWTMMREIRLPDHLTVGQGYGTVAWAVRTIWETYAGWFKLLSSTELYPDRHAEALASLAAALGVPATLTRARAALDGGDAALAVVLGEAAAAADPGRTDAARLLVNAHRRLLDEGGKDNFWAHGWLQRELERWAVRATSDAEPPAVRPAPP
jgi:glyoxylase-like metal-dependent hydrolase (beta-lactamase superfamily II)